MASSDVATYSASNPLGVLISNVVGRLAFSDRSLQPLSQYFFASGMGGAIGAPVISRRFPLESQFSSEVLGRLPHSLTSGQSGSEWEIGYNF